MEHCSIKIPRSCKTRITKSSGGDYFPRNGEELPFQARDIFISWLGKRREIGDGREIVGYEYVLQVFKSASSRSREENSLCMQSRDGEERRRCGSLRKRARFIASALNTIKITVGDRSSGVVNAVQKEEKKKRKSVVWKAVAVFKGQRNEREVPREQWNRFYFPMILDPVWLLRPFRSNRFLLTFSTRS